MTKNIENAFDAANAMVEDCNKIIDELIALKEVYQQLGKNEEYNSDPDRAAIDLQNYIKTLQDNNSPLPIRGIFSLATDFRDVEGIDMVIKTYEGIGNYWIKIRDQLGQD